MEEKIRIKGAARFSFINATDPFHPYYQHRLALVKSGTVPEAAATGPGVANKTAASDVPADGRPTVPHPPPFEFALDPPNINAVDLDIIKLTALFTARSGRRFQTDLQARERHNYQFDFLQPSHSTFAFFNKLVEQYTKILIPDPARLAAIRSHAGLLDVDEDWAATDEQKRMKGRAAITSEINDRVQWATWEQEQEKKQKDLAEKERVAFQEIDWQDFVVVSTVEFTEADDMISLAEPQLLADLMSMSLKEKKKATLQMEGKEMAMENDEEDIMQQARQAAANAAAAQDGDEMEVDSGDEAADARKKADEIKTADTTSAVKIKPAGYVPRCAFSFSAACRSLLRKVNIHSQAEC